MAEHLLFELTLRTKTLVDSVSCAPSDLVLGGLTRSRFY
jgi:hypothetical protein